MPCKFVFKSRCSIFFVIIQGKSRIASIHVSFSKTMLVLSFYERLFHKSHSFGIRYAISCLNHRIKLLPSYLDRL